MLQDLTAGDIPVVLVGNKTDQVGDRMVSLEEGKTRSREIGCVCFHEISVRESPEQVRMGKMRHAGKLQLFHCEGPQFAVFYAEQRKVELCYSMYFIRSYTVPQGTLTSA